MKTVKIGMIGAGFVAQLHMYSLRRVCGLDIQVTAVCCRTRGNAEAFARQHGISSIETDYKKLLANPDIDVIDICAPAVMHAKLIEEAVITGKHVICEKPFTGYFGEEGDVSPIGHVDKKKMYNRVLEQMEQTAETIRRSGKIFMYAENWIYAPMIVKAAEILRATQDKILFMKAEESHSGSHAWHAAEWGQTGGGALIRQGVHPLSAILWLKMQEARNRGEKFGIESVVAEAGNVTASLSEHERRFIAARPVDVEDWAMATLKFKDGTHATIFAGDFVTGGVRNLVEFNTNTGTVVCNIAPNDGMKTYFATGEKLSDIYLTKKVENKAGWQFVCIEEELMRGYIGEMQDFMECVASGREPLSGLGIAVETIKATYAAYLSAEKGMRIKC